MAAGLTGADQRCPVSELTKGCGQTTRGDGACKFDINLDGSLQNPSISPDGAFLYFTRFRSGYNKGTSEIWRMELATKKLEKVTKRGDININLPGNCPWNLKQSLITYAGTREGTSDAAGEQVYGISSTSSMSSDEKSGASVPEEERLTPGSNSDVYFEPTFSCDNSTLSFEVHSSGSDEDSPSVIGIVDAGPGSSGQKKEVKKLTDPEVIDARQPCFSPTDAGVLAYQGRTLKSPDEWSVYIAVLSPGQSGGRSRIADASLQSPQVVANGTDVSFSPDGKYILYSGREGTLLATKWKRNDGDKSLNDVPPQAVAVTNQPKWYDGAPGWEPKGGCRVVFESIDRDDPDNSPGTSLWAVPTIWYATGQDPSPLPPSVPSGPHDDGDFGEKSCSAPMTTSHLLTCYQLLISLYLLTYLGKFFSRIN